MHRYLYIIAYDICKPGRLSKIRKVLKGYSTGGQKSVFECFLTQGELKKIIGIIKKIIDPKEDRVHIINLDARSKVHTLCIALPPHDPEFFYFG